MLRDLSERKRAEEELKKSEDRFRRLFEDDLTGNVLCTPEGRIVLCNPSFASIFGFSSPEEAVGTSMLDLFIDRGERKTLLEALTQKGNLGRYEAWRKRRDGRLIHVLENIVGRFDERGELCEIKAYIFDDTDRKRAENRLEEAGRLLQNMIDSARNSHVAYLDRDFNFVRVNEPYARACGYKPQEMVGKNHFTLYPHEENQSIFARVRDMGVPVEFHDKPFVFPDQPERGTTYWDWTLTPVKDPSGYVEGLVLSLFETTERKRNELLLRARSTLLEYASSNTTDELLRKSLDEISALTESPIGFFHFVDEDQKTLTLQTWSTRTEREFCKAEGKGLHYPITEAGVWVDCVQTKAPVVHNDYPSLPHRKGMPDGHPPISRELVVPILRHDRVMAILGVGNKPSHYTRQDIESVSYLADVTWEAAMRRQSEEALQRSNGMLSQAQELGHLGSWELDLVHNRLSWSDEVYRIIGLQPQEFGARYEAFLEAVHPEDRKAVDEAYSGSLRDGSDSYQIEHRVIRRSTGEIRFVFEKCYHLRDASGRVVRSIGMVQDITERKLIENTQLFLAQTGDEYFFESLARHLGQTLGMDYVCIDRLEGEGLSARTLAIYFDGKFEDNVTYALKDTPCGEVMREKHCIFPRDVRHLFPRDQVLQEMKAESYVGTLLRDSIGQPIGLIAVIGRKPLENQHTAEAILELAGIRAAGELERRQAEEALRQSEERFHRLFEEDLTGDFLCRPEGKILLCNPSFAKIFGFSSPDEAVGTNVLDLYPDPGERISILEALRQEGKIEGYEAWRKRRDGEAVHVVENMVAHFDNGGEITEIKGYVFEDTNRKRAEEAAEEAWRFVERERTLLQSMIDTARNSHLAYMDRGFNFMRVNEAYARTCGYRPEEMIGKNHFALYPHKENEAIFARVRDTGVPVEFHDKPFIFPDQPERGVTYWDWTLTPVKDRSGAVEGLVFSLFETTGRKRAEEALKQSEAGLARAQAIAHLANWEVKLGADGIFGTEDDIVHGSAELYRIFNLERDRNLGAYIKKFHPDDRAHVVESIRAAIYEGKPYKVEYRVIPRASEIRHVYAEGEVIRDENGLPLRFFGTFQDITERKDAEEALRQSEQRYKTLSRDLEIRVRERTAELERRNKELQEFVTVAAHDLNEPLRKIQTFGSLLEERRGNGIGELERDYMSRMTGSAGRMRDLIDALLLYSRISGRDQEFVPVELEEIVRKVTGKLEHAIRSSKGRVEISSLPRVSGDPDQLRHLFNNLIENAVKFRRPNIEPLIKIHAASDGKFHTVVVEDNGIGVEEKYVDKIFQPFQRLHGRQEYPGTGIGLTICRKVVERHGGMITARSTLGKGSTFIVNLPAA